MTFNDMLNACIDFQSEVRFCYFDGDDTVPMTLEEARALEIKYVYPLGHDALMVEVEYEEIPLF